MDAALISALLLGSAAVITAIGGVVGLFLPFLRRQEAKVDRLNETVNGAEPGDPHLRQVSLEALMEVGALRDEMRRGTKGVRDAIRRLDRRLDEHTAQDLTSFRELRDEIEGASKGPRRLPQDKVS